MKRTTLIAILLMLTVVFSTSEAAAKKYHPHHRTHHAAGVDSDAEYADIVIDAQSGRVLHAEDADDLRHPASLTKMMTLYLAFQALEAGHLSLGQYLPVSQNASYQSPSKLGLHAGQRIRVEDVILGIVTESANDAAVVMGEALGGSEEGFADMMNKQARALGMTNTHYRNPSGLPDPEQVTTAHDMAILGAALINHYKQFYPYFSHDSFTYAGIYHHNHNHLMDRYEGMDGIKTGYIRASGFNLVASAKHGNTRLIGVVFGGRSAVERDNHMAQLLDQSFAAAHTEARAEEVNGEGDSSDSGNGEYVELPAKIAAIYPSREAEETPAPVVQQTQPASRPMQVASLQPLPKPPAAAVTHSSWGVQIGAYSDAAIGQQALAALVASMPDVLSKAEPQVQKVSAGGSVMYRARMMALDKKTAQSICSYLIQRGKSCLTVEP